ncbi:MAG: neutral/alkaline non-lysosomal ceramidase N-terminal domain-containing protein [Eubacteriales bacterium]|nr:neutral/alkaline non-lysosomal ceramidase N-terminal domain-containing protein [Eubacteriales bacterium]
MLLGKATREITPRGPVYLMGYAARWGRKTRGEVHDPIYTKALYLQKGGERLLLITADLCELTYDVCSRMRQKIAEATGVPHVVIALTHTHSAPNTAPQAAEDDYDPQWLEWVLGRMTEAALEAIASPTEALVSAAQTVVQEVGKNRRPGKTVTDPTLTVLAFTGKGGEVVTLLVNYACHATVLDGNSYAISADYPGFLYRQLEARCPGAMVQFTNGAAGDINIGYSSDATALGVPMDFRTFAVAEQKAAVLSEKIAEMLKTMPEPVDDLQVIPFAVDYPLRKNRPTAQALRAELAKLAAEADAAPDGEARQAKKLKWIYAMCLLQTQTGVGEGETKSTESMLLKIGDALLVTTPTELFAEGGMAVKAALPQGHPAVVLGYANGYVAYLPTPEAMREGGYEAETTPFAETAMQTLVDRVGEAAQKLRG